MERQLAAILYADVAGYSRLTGSDEEATQRKLNVGLDLLTELVVAYGGKKLHEAGDAILAEFQSVTAAVDAAIEFQRQMSVQNESLPVAEQLQFRIGVNLSEVLHDRNDIYGDGVNVAARLQELADPGGLCVSAMVREQIEAHVDQAFDDLGYRKFKNIHQSVHVHRARLSEVSEVHPILMAPAVKGQPLFDDELEDSLVITGRCLCGAVRYEITEPAMGTGFCHCRICQRALGGPINAWAAFPIHAVRFVNIQPKYYRSSLIGERGFCANCGTSLTTRILKPTAAKYLAVSTASLDKPEDFAPNWHGGLESQMPWLDVHDELPRKRCEESPVLIKAWESVGVTNPADWRELQIASDMTE